MAKLVTLYDLEDGDNFEWRGRKYKLIRIDAISDEAIVEEENISGEQKFNPYAHVRPL